MIELGLKTHWVHFFQISPTVHCISWPTGVATNLILGRGDNWCPGSELDLRSLCGLCFLCLTHGFWLLWEQAGERQPGSYPSPSDPPGFPPTFSLHIYTASWMQMVSMGLSLDLAINSVTYTGKFSVVWHNCPDISLVGTSTGKKREFEAWNLSSFFTLPSTLCSWVMGLLSSRNLIYLDNRDFIHSKHSSEQHRHLVPVSPGSNLTSAASWTSEVTCLSLQFCIYNMRINVWLNSCKLKIKLDDAS